MVGIDHRTFTTKSTRNTSTAWISCKTKHINTDSHEPTQLNNQPNDTIWIGYTGISEAYPTEEAVVELPSVVGGERRAAGREVREESEEVQEVVGLRDGSV